MQDLPVIYEPNTQVIDSNLTPESDTLPSPVEYNGSPTPIHGAPRSWFGLQLPPKQSGNMPPDTTPGIIRRVSQRDPRKDDVSCVVHNESWRRTRDKVIQALRGRKSVVIDGTRLALEISSELLGLAPVPGLQEAAKTLLGIWDAVNKIETNRFACLRLVERCADVLISIRDEISEGQISSLNEDLNGPIEKLDSAFHDVSSLLIKQCNRPFLQRYIKRSEIQNEITECQAALSFALEGFNAKILARLFRQQDQNEASRKVDHALVLERLDTMDYKQAGNSRPVTPATVLDTLTMFQEIEDRQDRQGDAAELRSLMKHAVEAKDDVEMLHILQIKRDEILEAKETLQRALSADKDQELEDISLSEKTLTHGSEAVDSLDREFMQSGVESLHRLSASRGDQILLPSWTITRYEVDRQEKIGIGFFSNVYRGTWHDRAVAIKVLTNETPRKLFIREVEIWKTLNHPNVLELYGASSTTAEPPWFLVSPYCQNGSLVGYLQNLPGKDPDPPGVDLMGMIHEIAKGMAYLHGRGVLHGDLKAANVLVTNDRRCVISDFGQSEMRNEAYRISGTPLPRGTLRWQAPEILRGQQDLTPEIDVYAFAICCVEIVSKGCLPWPLADDDAVRYFVLELNLRPGIPTGYDWRVRLSSMLNDWWHQSPTSRPSFTDIVESMARLRTITSEEKQEHDSLGDSTARPSSVSQLTTTLPISKPETETVGRFVNNTSARVAPFFGHASKDCDLSDEETSATVYAGDESLYGQTTASQVSFWTTTDVGRPSDIGQTHPSAPTNIPIPEASTAYETRESHAFPKDLCGELYRSHLAHNFHPSLTWPLWSPSLVRLGDIGYIHPSDGTFVVLFNSFEPAKSSRGLVTDVPSVRVYGNVSSKSRKQGGTRFAKGIKSVLTFGKKDSVSHSAPLYNGQQSASLFTDAVVFRYMKNTIPAKKWLSTNGERVLKMFSKEGHISKDRNDLLLVTSTLEARHYALFVNHSHPNGKLNLDVSASPVKGAPWGRFSTTTDLSVSQGQPEYRFASRVSYYDEERRRDTLLLGFMADGEERIIE